MFAWIGRHRGSVTFALTLLVAALGIANIWKRGLVSTDWLTTHKDSLDALNTILTMLVLVAGAIFSYYRFFRGRMLSLRTELSLEVSVHETPHHGYLHAITLTAKNVGASTIWRPHPMIVVDIHGSDAANRTIDDWWEEAPIESARGMVALIESEETVTFFAHQHIPKEAWAVTYRASLRADQGDVWHISKTFTNAVAKNN